MCSTTTVPNLLFSSEASSLFIWRRDLSRTMVVDDAGFAMDLPGPAAAAADECVDPLFSLTEAGCEARFMAQGLYLLAQTD